MQKVKKQILPVLVSVLAIVALAMTPALAKDSKNKKPSLPLRRWRLKQPVMSLNKAIRPTSAPTTLSLARPGKPSVEP